MPRWGPWPRAFSQRQILRDKAGAGRRSARRPRCQACRPLWLISSLRSSFIFFQAAARCPACRERNKRADETGRGHPVQTRCVPRPARLQGGMGGSKRGPSAARAPRDTICSPAGAAQGLISARVLQENLVLGCRYFPEERRIQDLGHGIKVQDVSCQYPAEKRDPVSHQ